KRLNDSRVPRLAALEDDRKSNSALLAVKRFDTNRSKQCCASRNDRSYTASSGTQARAQNFTSPPDGRVTRGASGPSIARRFLSGSSRKRRNLKPTSLALPAASFAALSVVDLEM